MGILFAIVGFFLLLYVLLHAIETMPKEQEHAINAKLAERRILEEENLRKGTSFEQIITQEVQKRLKDAVVINNCILNKRTKAGEDMYINGMLASKEIDIIILSKKGLFALESKFYQGAFVSGTLEDRAWKVSYSKSKIFEKYSPFKQVTEAVTTLKRYLPDYNFQREVVFPDSTKISANLKGCEQVWNLKEFCWFIEEVAKRPDTVSANSIQLIKELLIEENERARTMHANAGSSHVDFVKGVQGMEGNFA
jgi:hypothetical protein